MQSLLQRNDRTTDATQQPYCTIDTVKYLEPRFVKPQYMKESYGNKEEETTNHVFQVKMAD